MPHILIPKAGDTTNKTLGKAVIAWMEGQLVHGPGAIRGAPYRIDADKKLLVMRAYELKDNGRRRFKRGGISIRKGWAKTEFGAAVCAAELTPTAPIRFLDWAKGGESSEEYGWLGADNEPYIYSPGEPIGKGLKDPYIPMLAYSEEQSEELAYGALLAMIGEGPLGESEIFELGYDKIIVLGPHGQAEGKAVALSSSPGRDGARTTFQLFDETHRMDSEKLIKAHTLMLNNIPKRALDDAWTLEITTAFEPGIGSVAEKTMEYAENVAENKVKRSSFFFYHRQAGDAKLWDEDGEPDIDLMKAAVIEASGPAAAWSDIDSIVDLVLDPAEDHGYWERVWLNRPVQQSLQAFPIDKINKLVVWKEGPRGHKEFWTPPKGDLIVMGFDGSQTNDTTAIVGTHMATGYQFLAGVWANPGDGKGKPLKGWRVPAQEVDQAVAFMFEQYTVHAMYCDPYYWDTHVADWIARYMRRGKPRVFEWHTNVNKRMALSIKAYTAAMNEGVWKYDGHPQFRSHLANAKKYAIPILDEDGQNLYLIHKERPDSPNKIDIAMAGCLSWEAYRDAVAAGTTIRVRSKRPITIM